MIVLFVYAFRLPQFRFAQNITALATLCPMFLYLVEPCPDSTL